MAKQIVGHLTELVGRHVANRRKAKKIPPEELAKKIGVSPTVLDHMEHGACHINIEQLALFARYVAPLEDLLSLPHCNGDQMAEYVDKRIRAMSEEELRAWQQDTVPLASDSRRIFILDSYPEPE